MIRSNHEAYMEVEVGGLAPIGVLAHLARMGAEN